MSDFLEPRSVTVGDIPEWFRESVKLLTRHWLFSIGLTLSYHFLAYCAESFRLFSFLAAVLLCQIGVCVSIMGAKLADQCCPITPKAIYALVRNILLTLVLLTIAYAAIYLVGAAVVLTLGLEPQLSNPGASTSNNILTWLTPGQTAFLILYMGITITTLWFLTPLIALTDLTLRDAVLLAKRAESKNQWVVFVVSYVPCATLAIGSLLSQWTLVLGAVVFPLFGIFQYVAYRHVFLGKTTNRPAPVAVVETVPGAA